MKAKGHEISLFVTSAKVTKNQMLRSRELKAGSISTRSIAASHCNFDITLGNPAAFLGIQEIAELHVRRLRTLQFYQIISHKYRYILYCISG